ncbi:hypothetical protein PIROE2DRAFT_16400 [Piromyces sp. E2]|nr:hypothetical protein PIROE2DRAFT_16400 [Piromyces sp. E2]|eukprot:OUM58353.1 hypothetical protein PIROE2DRAFT_16400 [Piromyces sp. E2]
MTIIERLNKGYLIPFIQFSKPSQLSSIVEEEVLQEINHFIEQHYANPNEQLYRVVNIAKAVEYFILKGVPFATLRLHWNHPSYLTLLERVGEVLDPKKFKININLKTFDVAYLDISIKMLTSFMDVIRSKKINGMDVAVAKELIHYFENHPLADVQRAILDPSIGLASPYSKLIVKTVPKDLHDVLTCHITANKNGVSYQVLKRHPDFEVFLRKNFIHRYLYTYRHSLYVDQTSQPEKIYIKYKGQMKNWEEIKDQLKYREDGVTMTGRYAQQGLVDDNVFNWTELTSFICRNEHEEIIEVEENPQKPSSLDNDDNSVHDDDHTLIEYRASNSRESSDLEDLQTLDSDDSEHEDYQDSENDNDNDNNDNNDNNNNELIFQSILSKIDDYKNRYQVFSDIYKDTFQENSKENVEKFLYYDTRINKSKDPYEHTWGNRYLLEYCFWIVSQPRLSGDHAFIKLKTPSNSNCVTWTQEIAALAGVYFPCDYPMTKLLFKNHHFS